MNGPRLEASRWLSAAPVGLFAAAFAVGLTLYLLAPESPAAAVALNVGIIILIGSPVVRIAVETADRIRRRDWTFVAMTAVICAELLFVLVRAARS